MKKFITLCAAMLCAAMSFGASYGILVNGKTYFAGSLTGEFEGFTQYLAHVQVKSGDYCQLYDADNQAAWVKPLNSASVAGFTYDEANQRYNVTATGCFDFYIKLKYGQDELYIGTGSDCGTGTEIGGGGSQGGGGTEGNPRFMWKAELDGEWQEPSTSTTFVAGRSNIMFYTSAYLFLIYQVDGVAGVEYMCESYTTETHARFVRGGSEKWGVPGGTTELYLYDNEDGSVEVSNQPMAGKKLWTAGGQNIVNPTVSDKARKVIIDGQLRIIRGGKIFDATGKEL